MDWNRDCGLAKGYLSEYDKGYQDGSMKTAEKFYKDIHDIIKKSDGFLCEEVLRITAKQFGAKIKGDIDKQ